MTSNTEHEPMDIDLLESTIPLRPHSQMEHQERPVHSGDVNVPAPAIPLQGNTQTRRRNHQRRRASTRGISSPAPAFPLRSRPQARLQEQKPSRLHGFSQPKALQQGALFALTDELKVDIFSYIPAQKVVSNLRATCQELCNFIDGHENRIADTIANRELRRLQSHGYQLKSFGPPASVKQFLESLRVFTEQRGMITSDQHVSRVAAKWVRHLFRNVFPYAIDETGRDDKWAVLAKDFFQLQEAFAEDVRRGVPKRDCRQSFMLMNRHWDTASLQLIMEVYELVKASPTNQPYFPGTIHGRNVLEVQTWPELRLTMAYKGKICLHPVVPYDLVHLLDLPKLPQDKVFFYYVEEEWVCKEIERGPLCSMLKAAVLQLIKIF